MLKKFEGRAVSVKLRDIKFICDVDYDIPGSIYSKFPIIDDDSLEEWYSFDDIGVYSFFKYCDEILDYDEYMSKDLVELYNAIDLLNDKYDVTHSAYGEKNRKILCYNIKEIKSIIREKESSKKIR